jgi:hypothetical protein
MAISNTALEYRRQCMTVINHILSRRVHWYKSILRNLDILDLLRRNSELENQMALKYATQVNFGSTDIQSYLDPSSSQVNFQPCQRLNLERSGSRWAIMLFWGGLIEDTTT